MNFQPPHAGLLAYRTYGGWGVQRPEHGTLGRYSPDMTKLLPDGRTFALTLRLDRAAYQLYREAGASHKQALHNAPGHGSWEIELQAPASDRVELVAMLWPQNDREWPLGEINFIEGRVGNGQTKTNLHWPNPDTGDPDHAPEEIPLDVTHWHHYQVDIDPGQVRWFVDGRLRRELHTPHAPHKVPVHLTIHAGVNSAILDDWHDNLEWEQTILFRPLRMCGESSPRTPRFFYFRSSTDVPPQKLNPVMMSVPFDPSPAASFETCTPAMMLTLWSMTRTPSGT